MLEAEKEYLKRLAPFAKAEVITVEEFPLFKGATRESTKKKEASEIINRIPKDTFLIALDEHGKQLNSLEFAEFIRNKRDFEGGNLTFVIGGCYGLDPSIIEKADLKLSFSRLTFTHELIRVLLVEQIYRAFTILSGKTYHY